MSQRDAHLDVEAVATAIASAVGSPVFGPLQDTGERQRVREQFRRLAAEAIELSQIHLS